MVRTASSYQSTSHDLANDNLMMYQEPSHVIRKNYHRLAVCSQFGGNASTAGFVHM